MTEPSDRVRPSSIGLEPAFAAIKPLTVIVRSREHGMKATATFGHVWQKHGIRPIPTDHPIIRDPRAIEAALATVLDAARRDAVRMGTTPEMDIAAAAFRREHGLLAAMIANPLQESLVEATHLLWAALIRVASSEEVEAMAARLAASTNAPTRYAADTRSRH